MYSTSQYLEFRAPLHHLWKSNPQGTISNHKISLPSLQQKRSPWPQPRGASKQFYNHRQKLVKFIAKAQKKEPKPLVFSWNSHIKYSKNPTMLENIKKKWLSNFPRSIHILQLAKCSLLRPGVFFLITSPSLIFFSTSIVTILLVSLGTFARNRIF